MDSFSDNHTEYVTTFSEQITAGGTLDIISTEFQVVKMLLVLGVERKSALL
jgi:hypothetical protein